MLIDVLLNAYFIGLFIYFYFTLYIFYYYSETEDRSAYTLTYRENASIGVNENTLPFQGGIRVEHVVCPKWEWDASTDA